MYRNARLVTAGIAGLAFTALLLPARLVAQPAATPAPTPYPAAAAPPADATAPAATAPFGEQVDVTEVLLDAQVTDREGNVIVGLGPGDFKVEEDGKPVPVTAVTFYSSRPQLTATGKQAVPAQSQRYYILFFHDQRHMNTEVPHVLEREMDAGRRTRDWVNHLAAGDLVAVCSYNMSLIVDQDFTNDSTLLRKAIDQAVQGGSRGGNWPSRLPPESQSASLLRNLPKGNAVRDQSANIYDAFRLLARAAKPIVGRKNLVLFSSGFGEVNNFNQYTPDLKYDQPARQALNDANIAVYSVDLLEATTESPLQGSLSNFAVDTGGRYFQNQLTFDTPLRLIAEETSGYYLLSYRATHKRGETGFQKVKVSTTNPELRVKARAGYVYGD